MNERARNTLIGIFVIAACCLVLSLILFLEPATGDGKKTMHIRFANINKINVGTRVLYAGKPVGEVVEIQEIVNARDQPTDHMGRLYFYDLKLKLDSSVDVYSCDTVCIQTSGLLGEKSIAIIPMPNLSASPATEITTNPVYADSSDPIETAFEQLSKVSTSMQQTLLHVNDWMKEYGQDTGKAIQSFGNTMTSVNSTIKQLNDQGTFDHTAQLVQNLNLISAKINSGNGTISKLLDEDGLYLQTNAVLSKVETMMNDINQYGILFHLNKGWQRVRLKKMSVLETANSPEDYTSLFNSELSELNNSMVRLGMITNSMEKTKDEAFVNNKEFTQAFLNLLDRSKQLTENLKLFNEQMVASKKP